MSAADGRLSAPIAASCALTAFSRAENARVIALLISGFSSRSEASLPSASSLWRDKPLAQALAVLVNHRPNSLSNVYVADGTVGAEEQGSRPQLEVEDIHASVNNCVKSAPESSRFGVVASVAPNCR